MEEDQPRGVRGAAPSGKRRAIMRARGGGVGHSGSPRSRRAGLGAYPV